MDRIDDLVEPALEKVRRQHRRPKRFVVASLVVVLDLEVTISEQTVGDHQVVRLVAAETLVRLRISPNGKHQGEGDHEHGPMTRKPETR